MITDTQVLDQHSPACRRRASLELKIVNRLLREAKAKGYTVKIDDGDDGPQEVEDPKALIFNLDECYVHLFKDGKRMGWVRLVMGNDGWDAVCDYTVNLEDFLKPINELAERLSNGRDR